jgi:hypothetical protein
MQKWERTHKQTDNQTGGPGKKYYNGKLLIKLKFVFSFLWCSYWFIQINDIVSSQKRHHLPQEKLKGEGLLDFHNI